MWFERKQKKEQKRPRGPLGTAKAHPCDLDHTFSGRSRGRACPPAPFLRLAPLPISQGQDGCPLPSPLSEGLDPPLYLVGR